MTNWLDLSSSSNRLKQSYFRDFVDVSGNVKIRNDHHLQLYSIGDSSQPRFSINSNEMSIYNGSDVTDISNNKLIYLNNLSENVQSKLTSLTQKTQYLDSDDGNTTLNSNLVINGEVEYKIGIGKNSPSVVLDISSTNAIRLPIGTTDERPYTSGNDYKGYIRYNSERDEFEGYGSGNAWKPFGGDASKTITNDSGDTYIDTGLGDSKNLVFYTNNVKQMEIDASGDISMNSLYVENNVILNSKLSVINDTSFNANVTISGETKFNSDVTISGNLIANYPVESIHPNAIIGVGRLDGGINVGVYISDEVTFDDTDFVLVKEDKSKVQITPYGIFVTDEVTFDTDNFSLFKENPVPVLKTDLNISGGLYVVGDTTVKTVSLDDYSNAIANTIFVKSQGFIHNDALMKQFVT